MDSCGRCMKVSLICINVVTFLGGLCALGVGAWAWAARGYPGPLLGNNLFAASLGAVAASGAAAAALAVLGCCGAAKEVKCMLLTYYILVFIVFVTMLVGGVLLFVFRAKLESSLDRELYAAIPAYGVRHEVTRAWDDTHTLLQCCGARSYRDWNGNVPDSCCREVYVGQRLDCKYSPNPTTMYTEGCLPRAGALLREDAAYAGAVAVAVSLVLLLSLILSCGLFVKIE